MSDLYSQYCHALGVPADASLGEIKQAFREKAKEFHPDLNHSPGASEEFIAINEAYTFLLKSRENLVDRGMTNSATKDFYNIWEKKERDKARERAARRAKMKFDEYRKSPIYRTTSRLNQLTDLFGGALGVFIILASAFGLYNQGLYVIENEQEVLNIKGIVLDILMTIAGTAFVLVSLSSIRRRMRINNVPFTSTF